MKQFEVNRVRYIGVEVPEGVTDFSVGNEFLQSRPYKRGTKLNKLPPGNYEIVGIVKKLPLDTLYPLEVGYKNSNKYIGQPLNEPTFTPNTLILKIKENE